jgi:hypothetical protein
MIALVIMSVIAANVIKYLTTEDQMGLFDIFKKKQSVEQPAETTQSAPVTKEPKPRKPRKPKKTVPAETVVLETAKAEVKVLKFDFDPENPRLGSIELDWNPEFIQLLKDHGYLGNKEEDLVDAWLSDVCRTISGDVPYMDGNVRYIQKRKVGDGKTEFR